MEHNRERKQINDELLALVMSIFERNYDITTDSRKVKRGSIFIAIKGERFNANEFASQALEQGADLVIIDDENYYVDDRTLLVENTLTFIQKFASYYRHTFDIPFLAISGTNGKTTTKELIHAVLSKKYVCSATVGNYNNQLGVPLTLLSLKKDCQIAIIEMGASHLGDIDELCQIADPDIALLTNVGTAHIEGFGSFEGVIQTKTELFRYVENKKGKIFLNLDDGNLREYAPNTATTYSLHEKADYQGRIADMDSSFASVRFGNIQIDSHLVGSYNCYNMMAAVSVGLYFGVELDQIKQAIEEYVPSNNRSQIKKTQCNTLILDCYNANPSSCRTALRSFLSMRSSNKIVMIGAMKELGSVSQSEHQDIADILSNMNLKLIVFVGEEYKPYCKYPNALWFENSLEAKEYLSLNPITDSLILIKGSRSTKMERLADVL